MLLIRRLSKGGGVPAHLLVDVEHRTKVHNLLIRSGIEALRLVCNCVFLAQGCWILMA